MTTCFGLFTLVPKHVAISLDPVLHNKFVVFDLYILYYITCDTCDCTQQGWTT